MAKHTDWTWGFWGLGSALLGMLSCFVPGFAALVVGLVAVALGVLGVKRQQKLSSLGMLSGCTAMLFVNLVNMGIVPVDKLAHADRTYLINSINGSINVYEALGAQDQETQKREHLLQHIRYTLNEAAKVDVEEVELQVEDFALHYEEEFVAGMKALRDGVQHNDIGKKLQGGVLLDRWAVWNQSNKQALSGIKKPAVSVFSAMCKIFS